MTDKALELAEAIRLTVEYVGNDTLPAKPGWSWFDALNKYYPEFAQRFVDDPIIRKDPIPQSNLVDHARKELALVGEDPQVIEGYINIVRAFSNMNHSGGSASVAIPVIHELLQFKNLMPLTDDPDEWYCHEGITYGTKEDLWQNKRCGEAFSHDGGKTYYLLSEGGNDKTRAPMHESKHKES